MQITLTGATGFMGSKLTARLLPEGHQLRILGRSRPQTLAAGVKFYPWDLLQGGPPLESLEGADAIIHLAGEPVAQRWSASVKERLQSSRVEATRQLVKAVSRLAQKPKVLIAASAVGYYGDRGDEILIETSPPGTDYLAKLCVAWEQEEDRAQALGLRVTRLRFGIVLGIGGGALQKMLPPFRMGVGGRIGNGKHWMSWVHVNDAIGMILFALHKSETGGVLNVTSPNPVRNKEFTTLLGDAIHRPTLFPVPPLALKLLYGEMSGILTASQRVEPSVAQRNGYQFAFTDLQQAFADLLTSR